MRNLLIIIFLNSFSNSLNVHISQTIIKDNNTNVYCTGNAQTSPKTDRLKINLEIVTNNTDRTVSLNQNIKISNSVMSALTKLGLQNDDFETTSFSIIAATFIFISSFCLPEKTSIA